MCQLDRQIELQTIIVRGVRQGTGLHERIAIPIADAVLRELQRAYAGERIYVPAPDRRARQQAMRDAAALGHSVKDIARDFDVSLPTVYRALNDSTPK